MRAAQLKAVLPRELLASVVVFLVALPLCMGIAIASGMPPAKGLITGIIGGLVGVGLSAAISLVFNRFVTDFPMDISILSVIGAVVCSTAIGVAFGFMPANKASKLNPIDALAQD